MSDPQSVYDFVARDVDGVEVPLRKYEGQVLLIVNTCSKGGAYHKIRKLQTLQDRFADYPFRILAFPCNQFMFCERTKNDEIKDFYIMRERVTFPVFGRIRVNGMSAHPLFKWLKKRARGELGQPIEHNFTIFLVEADGFTVHRFEHGSSWFDLSVLISSLMKRMTDREPVGDGKENVINQESIEQESDEGEIE